MSFSNRRKFERFPVADTAIAYDTLGHKLGTVIVAGGGGMGIRLDGASTLYKRGDRLRITVVEPERDIRHTVRVAVVYVCEDSLGVEFLTPAEA